MQEFDAYVDARASALARRAYLLTGDAHLAEDLLQDSLARVAQHWTSIERRGGPDAYVRKVMYHRAVDQWRRRRITEVMTDQPETHEELRGPYDAEETVVRRLMLRDALARLTPKQRAVLVLRFYEDLSEVETAAVLGCSVNTVKSQARHALARMRALAPELEEAFTTARGGEDR